MNDNDAPEKQLRLRKLSQLLRLNSLEEPIILNPFQHHYKFPWYEWLKVGLMSVSIAPIRLVFTVTTFGLASFFAYIGCINSSEETFIGTLPWWRKTLRYLVRCFIRLGFFFIGFHYVEMYGKRAHPKEAMIMVVAPHSSLYDTLFSVLGRTLSGISRYENSKILGMESLAKLMQPIFVKRDDERSKSRTIELLTERASYAGKMPQIIVFPEGTTTNRDCLINFKAGAFVPGVPVQPVLLRYPNRIDCMTWVSDGPNLLFQMWITLCQFHNRFVVEFLPVYYPSIKEKCDPKFYGNNVRKLMASSLDVPVTDHTYEDVQLMYLAKKFNLPQAAGIVEFSKMSRQLMINFNNVSEFIQYFAEISRELKGNITIEAFAEYLGLPISPAVEKLFSLYDRNRTGYIDFREYVIGMCLLTIPANTAESLHLAFEMFDTDKTGEVNETKFVTIMSAAFNMEYSACIRLFNEMDVSRTGSINYDDFIAFSKTKPEFVKVVSLYQDFHKEAQMEKVGSEYNSNEKLL